MVQPPPSSKQIAMTYKVLIIHRCIDYCSDLRNHLMESGITSVYTTDPKTGVEQTKQGKFAAVILDLELGGASSYKLLRALCHIPILIVTGGNDMEEIKRALEIGADDFCKGEFSGEIPARLKELVRKTHIGYPLMRRSADINVGPLKVCFGQRCAVLSGITILLTQIEVDILYYLARNQGRLISRDELINNAASAHEPLSQESLNAHIGALRKKLGHNAPGAHQYIRTYRGSGYMLKGP